MIIDAHVTISHDREVNPLLKSMQMAKIDYAFLAPSKAETAFNNHQGNSRLARICGEHTNLKFWAVASPWSGDVGITEIGRAFDCGAFGILFDPTVQGFSLLGPEIKNMLALISKFINPLIYVHTGTPSNALPLQLAHLANSFPNLSFLMGRSGRTDFRTDAIPAMQLAPNIYADTSHDYPMTGLSNLATSIGTDRMIFSSDYPYERQDFAKECIDSLPISFHEKSKILSGNVQLRSRNFTAERR